jgi:serine phosphatase RsbU (regulator of sigma subunit)/anti-sigma regulatory factor (Ser/Thr protein kinase)
VAAAGHARASGRLTIPLARVRDGLPRGRGLPAEDWNRRHRGILAVVWLHVAAIPAFGLAQGYGALHVAAETAPILAAALLGGWERLSRNARSSAVSIGLLTASAVLVHFSGGYIEFHFHFFAMIALLALYQHWLPFLLAIAYVAVHHGVGGVLDPDAVYNHPDGIAHPWKWAGIHAAFVLAASTANIFAWHYFEQEQAHRRDLLRLTEAALARLPLPELLEEVLLRVCEVLHADTATISLHDEHGRLVIEAARGGDVPDAEAVLALDDAVAAAVSTSRKPVALDEVDARAVANPVHRERGVTSLAGVPLLVGGTVIGVLDVGTVARRRFSSSDMTLLELAAERVAPAIDRARLYERDHRIAATLQRSLLPKDLPSLAGLTLAFRYEPAGESVEAGGDWYDAFPLSGGRIGLVMGDVVGRGTEAASLMGQLRTGLRAYAMEGHAPAEVLARLSRLARELDEDNMATVLYIELDTETMRARYASAGHLPPLIVSPAGETTFVEGRRGTPVGAPIEIRCPELEAQLEPGSTLVLYTDGLVEDRATGLEEGLAGLSEVAARERGRDLESLCDVLVREVPSKKVSDDDVAVLALRVEPSLSSELRLAYPAASESVSEMRRALERWLRERGADRSEAQQVVLACGEAAANAVEHAYGPGQASFEVVAEHRDGAVTVEVRDFGEWRTPRGVDRGRGLVLMQALMDEVDIDRRPDGTSVRMRRRVAVGAASGAELRA